MRGHARSSGRVVAQQSGAIGPVDEAGGDRNQLFVAFFAKKFAEHFRVLAHRSGAVANVPSIAELALVRLNIRASIYATQAIRRRLRFTRRPISTLAFTLFSPQPSFASHVSQSTFEYQRWQAFRRASRYSSPNPC